MAPGLTALQDLGVTDLFLYGDPDWNLELET